MTWFTASVLIAIKPEGYVSGSIQVYENMYLIEASTAHDAARKAEALGRQEASITADDLTIDDKPATRVFVGIRKLISVSNPEPLDLDQDRPIDGTEESWGQALHFTLLKKGMGISNVRPDPGNSTLPATSNRLIGQSGPVAKSYAYDAMGNLTGDGTYTYSAVDTISLHPAQTL